MKNKSVKIKIDKTTTVNMYLADEFNGFSIYDGSEFINLTTVRYLEKTLGFNYNVSKAPRVRFKNNNGKLEELVVADNIIEPDEFNVEYNLLSTLFVGNLLELNKTGCCFKEIKNGNIEIDLKFNSKNNLYSKDEYLNFDSESISLYSYKEENDMKRYNYVKKDIILTENASLIPEAATKLKRIQTNGKVDYTENDLTFDNYIDDNSGKVLSDLTSGSKIIYNNSNKQKLNYIEEEVSFETNHVNLQSYDAINKVINFDLSNKLVNNLTENNHINTLKKEVSWNSDEVSYNEKTILDKDKYIVLNLTSTSLANLNNNFAYIPKTSSDIVSLTHTDGIDTKDEIAVLDKGINKNENKVVSYTFDNSLLNTNAENNNIQSSLIEHMYSNGEVNYGILDINNLKTDSVITTINYTTLSEDGLFNESIIYDGKFSGEFIDNSDGLRLATFNDTTRVNTYNRHQKNYETININAGETSFKIKSKSSIYKEINYSDFSNCLDYDEKDIKKINYLFLDDFTHTDNLEQLDNTISIRRV